MVKLSTKKVGIDAEDFILDPTTGEKVSADDIDGLITLLEKMDGFRRRAWEKCREVEDALYMKVQGEDDKVTRRLKGKNRKVKITLSNLKWDQSLLKEAWNSYPDLRDDVMKIGSISVKLREFKKMTGTKGDPAYETFKGMVEKANKGRVGKPKFEIEE